MPGMEVRELALKTFQQEPVVGIYAKHFRQLGRWRAPFRRRTFPCSKPMCARTTAT
jgi:DNA polymerase-2